jgi:ribosomal protein S26
MVGCTPRDNLYISFRGPVGKYRCVTLPKRKKKNKKWGTYKKSGGRQRSVSCVYCGRNVPRAKATAVQKGMRMGGLRSVGVKRDQLMLPTYKFYACISCAKHRKLLK